MPTLWLLHENGQAEEFEIKAANRDGGIVVATTDSGTMYVPINNYEMVRILQ